MKKRLNKFFALVYVFFLGIVVLILTVLEICIYADCEDDLWRFILRLLGM